MPHDVLDFTQSYMRPVHNPELLLERAELLRAVECDTLVGTGLSGTIAVVELARKLKKNYLIVRSRTCIQHS